MALKPGTRKWAKLRAKQINNRTKYPVHYWDLARTEYFRWYPDPCEVRDGQRVYYTDYPLLEEERGKLAPLRPIHVLSYDYNLYCEVRYLDQDEVRTIKSGYIYTAPLGLGVAIAAKKIIDRETLRALPKKEDL